MIGHITYLSDDAMAEKFGRDAARRGRSSSISTSSSRSSPICATRGTSSPSTSTPTPICASPRRSTTSIRRPTCGGNLAAALARARAAFLVVSFTSDWRFSPARSREIVKALVDNRLQRELRGDRRAARPRRVSDGRPALPRADPRLLRQDEPGLSHGRSRQADALARRRPDFDAIASWIKPGAHVLDLGCGDGSLLRFLQETRGVSGYGIEIDDASVIASVRNGVNVIAERSGVRVVGIRFRHLSTT